MATSRPAAGRSTACSSWTTIRSSGRGWRCSSTRSPTCMVCGEAEEAASARSTRSQRSQPDVARARHLAAGPDGLELLKTIRAHRRRPARPDPVDARRVDLCRAGAAGRRQRLHHEAGGDREGAGRAAPGPRRRGLRERPDGEPAARPDGRARPTRRHESPLASLSDRELEVFRLIGDGHGTRQIADELHLSVKTVESYQAHIKEKLGAAAARASWCSYAIEWWMRADERATGRLPLVPHRGIPDASRRKFPIATIRRRPIERAVLAKSYSWLRIAACSVRFSSASIAACERSDHDCDSALRPR